jgi:hypothetical protein
MRIYSWLLEHMGQDSGEISCHELAEKALAGLAFDDLAQETDLSASRTAKRSWPLEACEL